LSISKQKVRYADIDRLKGWLIVLVIIGHIVLGTVHDNLIRFSIYAFHMPVFIGLTGYLINPKLLKHNSIAEIFLRYWWRVIIPFAFAYLFFTGILIVHAVDEARLTATLLLSYVLTPYYHLWFIPTLVIWVLSFSVMLKSKISMTAPLIALLLISLIWATVPVQDLWAPAAQATSKKVVYFFSFFLFGAWLRTASSRRLRQLFSDFKVLPVTLIVACAVIYLLNIGIEKSLLRAIVWMIMNIALITLLIELATSNSKAKSSLLSEIGRHSLPIYLWHVVPLFLLKGFDFHQTHVLAYYLVSLISVALIVAAILRYAGTSKLLDRCVYGTV